MVSNVFGSTETEIRQFDFESRLLCALQHNNIVTVLGVCTKTQPHMLILELMKDDLRSYLVKEAEYLCDAPETGRVLLGAAMQVAEAMAFLALKKVVHRDLAARYIR